MEHLYPNPDFEFGDLSEILILEFDFNERDIH